MIVTIFVFVAIIFLFSFSINYFEEVFAEEELVCQVGEVVVIRVNNPKPICVDQNTAERWSQLGITEIVGELIEEETEWEFSLGGLVFNVLHSAHQPFPAHIAHMGMV